MAACIPTLSPGYKWLRKRLKPRQNSSSAHLPLAENPGFRPPGDAEVSKPVKAHHADRDIANALLSETEATQASPNQIRKTIRVDVERNSPEDSVDHEGKPSLEINLGPDFEDLRSLWATVLDARRASLRVQEDKVWNGWVVVMDGWVEFNICRLLRFLPCNLPLCI